MLLCNSYLPLSKFYITPCPVQYLYHNYLGVELCLASPYLVPYLVCAACHVSVCVCECVCVCVCVCV